MFVEREREGINHIYDNKEGGIHICEMYIGKY